jgi:hypothetical protein
MTASAAAEKPEPTIATGTLMKGKRGLIMGCLLYTSPSPRDH